MQRHISIQLTYVDVIAMLRGVPGARIGINGFGRIGRMALRAAWGWPELEFAHVNELAWRRRPPPRIC